MFNPPCCFPNLEALGKRTFAAFLPPHLSLDAIGNHAQVSGASARITDRQMCARGECPQILGCDNFARRFHLATSSAMCLASMAVASCRSANHSLFTYTDVDSPPPSSVCPKH